MHTESKFQITKFVIVYQQEWVVVKVHKMGYFEMEKEHQQSLCWAKQPYIGTASGKPRLCGYTCMIKIK